jgi:hypothetical protein
MMGSDPSAQVRTLRIVAGAPNIDFVIYAGGGGGGPGWRPPAPGEPQRGPDPTEQAQRQVDMLVDVQRESGKPVVLVSNVPSSAAAFTSFQALQDAASAAGIAMFPTMRRAAMALRRLLDWEHLRD